MGGLVVKKVQYITLSDGMSADTLLTLDTKALIIGKHDDNYAAMLAKVHGIVFLSTPHKGSSLARTLNSMLSTLGRASKVYVSELDSSSTSIEDINEQFRAICDSWQLISLYETKPTKLVSGIKKMVGWTDEKPITLLD
jgi:hypothetical protein